MIRPMLEMLCLCAGAAAGIFLMNFLSNRMDDVKEPQEHECKCNHDADGDCCGGCGHCNCKHDNDEE